MSRALLIATLAALAAVCLAASVTQFQSLNNPTISAFEESIMISVATVEVPPFDESSDGPNKAFKRIAYDVSTSIYENSGSVFQRIWLLQSGGFNEVRQVVVDDVLKRVQEKTHASSAEEARKTVREACEAVLVEAKPALAEAEKIKDGWDRTVYLQKDQGLLRLAKVATFCNFL